MNKEEFNELAFHVCANARYQIIAAWASFMCRFPGFASVVDAAISKEENHGSVRAFHLWSKEEIP